MKRSAVDTPKFVKPGFPLVLRRVVGDGMYPTLEAHQLIVLGQAKRLCVGDIIVFRHKGREKIKRIHGIEGEFLYVLGDNPRFSTDSRQFGYIPRRAVLGRVIYPRTGKDALFR